jgi:hypothetical protein
MSRAQRQQEVTAVPLIESIQVEVNTLDVDGAGTDGSLYLGVCGREFHLDTSANDLEQGSARKYVLGDNANVEHKAINDPRKQRLLTEHVDGLPVYLRFVGNNEDDRWGLQRAFMTLNDELLPMWDTISYISDVDGIWLGGKAGGAVFLLRERDEG